VSERSLRALPAYLQDLDDTRKRLVLEGLAAVYFAQPGPTKRDRTSVDEAISPGGLAQKMFLDFVRE
jgi:hypothetical protein